MSYNLLIDGDVVGPVDQIEATLEDGTTQRFKVPKLNTMYLSPSDDGYEVNSADLGYDGFNKLIVEPMPADHIGKDIPRKSASTIVPSEYDQIIKSGQYLSGDQLIERIPRTYIGSDVPRRSAATITPTESKQTIPAGQYLEGAQTINPIPSDYINKSLLQSAIHYFDLSSNKSGNSTVDSSWYSFTPAFVPKVILFSQSEYNNGAINKISNSINTVVGSLWVDPDILPYVRYYAKGWFLTTNTTPSINMSSNGTGAQYDATKNKIFMYSKGSTSYGLKAGTNSQSAVSGYYMIQYWG